MQPKLDIVYGHPDTTFGYRKSNRSNYGRVNFTSNEPFSEGVRSANHQDFANVIPAEKKLARSKVLKQIFYVTVIEDPLQLKALNGLEFQSIFLDDMVP